MLDIFKRKRIVIMNESDLTKVLDIVNYHVAITLDDGLMVKCYDWEGPERKWFIVFYSINKQWERILEELKTIDSVEVV